MNTLLKKSSIFANLLMEKPDNSFAIVKMWKKQSLLVQINLLVSPLEESWLQMGYFKQLVG